MEGGVEVVVEWEAPFQGGRRGVVVGGEEVGEGFNFRPAEVEKAVVEDAQKPHPLMQLGLSVGGLFFYASKLLLN